MTSKSRNMLTHGLFLCQHILRRALGRIKPVVRKICQFKRSLKVALLPRLLFHTTANFKNDMGFTGYYKVSSTASQLVSQSIVKRRRSQLVYPSQWFIIHWGFQYCWRRWRNVCALADSNSVQALPGRVFPTIIYECDQSSCFFCFFLTPVSSLSLFQFPTANRQWRQRTTRARRRFISTGSPRRNPAFTESF